TRQPVPTLPGAPRKACPSPRSSAASSATPPARSIPTWAASATNSGGGLTRESAAAPRCWPSNDPSAAPGPLSRPAGRDLIRACPPWPNPVLSASPAQDKHQTHTQLTGKETETKENLDKHRSIVTREC